MPLRLEISPQARRDLLDIVSYIVGRNHDFIIAERLAERLLDRCQRLMLAPGSGCPYSPRPGTRKIIEGAYKIIYCELSDKIVVLRIWDGRRGHEPRIAP